MPRENTLNIKTPIELGDTIRGVDKDGLSKSYNVTDFATGVTGHIMLWGGEWTQQTYPQYTQVRDGSWLMVANKNTDERAAPQPIGEESYVYEGSSPTRSDIAKTVISGNRYTFQESGILEGYRMYVIAGNHYQVIAIRDPLGSRQITSLLDFTASTTGWVNNSIVPSPVVTDVVLDLVTAVNEPDPAPIVWTGNWNYQTPNNTTDAATGQVVQANKSTSILSINYIDNDLNDRTSELQSLVVGDLVLALGNEWAIQSVTPLASTIELGISPAVQGFPDGVTEFGFEVVVATPITYLADADYWLSTGYNIKGLISVGGGLNDLILNDTAYGTDLLFQRSYVSPDWDFASYTTF